MTICDFGTLGARPQSTGVVIRRAAIAFSSGPTLAMMALFALTACSPLQSSDSNNSPTSQGAVSQGPAIRQTDDLGKPLPFDTKHPKRWNSSNDGTAYEPCTTVDDRTARRVGLDHATAEDAATVSGQTLRGCVWHFVDPERMFWSADQVVADFSSLDEYKQANHLFTWREDTYISGRRVGVASMDSGNCFTYVQSRESGVMTSVVISTSAAPPLFEICDHAIQITRATIDKIPE
ncbi:DUF3558 family protein [Gordonia sp. LSe1-13]|uniref:DUF3558 family protein n=1 Tax=Gordonia sesuvii TaxID=3116777 RepID=A0ABU7MCW8_9ACTN|nr:DUF3558 family protein [Gordonia sp. LSe1-13]